MSTKKRSAPKRAATADNASPLEASPDNTPITITETTFEQAVGPNEEGLLDQVAGAHLAGEDYRQRMTKKET